MRHTHRLVIEPSGARITRMAQRSMTIETRSAAVTHADTDADTRVEIDAQHAVASQRVDGLAHLSVIKSNHK